MTDRTPERVHTLLESLTGNERAWLKMELGSRALFDRSVLAIKEAAQVAHRCAEAYGGDRSFWRERLFIAAGIEEAAPAEQADPKPDVVVPPPASILALRDRVVLAASRARGHYYVPHVRPGYTAVPRPIGISELARRVTKLGVGTESSVAFVISQCVNGYVPTASEKMLTEVAEGCTLIVDELDAHSHNDARPLTDDERVPPSPARAGEAND